jgi:hypothetical protein
MQMLGIGLLPGEKLLMAILAKQTIILSKRLS